MIVLLIGTSSTGKTTLSKHLQDVLPEYWQYMSLDLTFKGVPDRYAGGSDGPLAQLGFAYSGEGVDASITAGAWGHRVLEGMIQSAIRMNEAKVNIIFDDMILDQDHASIWMRNLADRNHLIIRLVAPKEVLLARIEKRSTPNGVAINHIEQNRLIPAELEINTSETSVAEAASLVAKLVREAESFHLE